MIAIMYDVARAFYRATYNFSNDYERKVRAISDKKYYFECNISVYQKFVRVGLSSGLRHTNYYHCFIIACMQSRLRAIFQCWAALIILLRSEKLHFGVFMWYILIFQSPRALISVGRHLEKIHDYHHV